MPLPIETLKKKLSIKIYHNLLRILTIIWLLFKTPFI